jgi:hypothetical protein
VSRRLFDGACVTVGALVALAFIAGIVASFWAYQDVQDIDTRPIEATKEAQP